MLLLMSLVFSFKTSKKACKTIESGAFGIGIFFSHMPETSKTLNYDGE